MDVRQVLVEVLGFNLTSDMQQRGASSQRLYQTARDIARCWAGAGDAHAQAGGGAGIGIGHIASASLATRHYEVHFAALGKGIKNGHVVNGNHAKGSFYIALLQKGRNNSAYGDFLRGRRRGVRHGESGLQKYQYGYRLCKKRRGIQEKSGRVLPLLAGPSGPREYVC